MAKAALIRISLALAVMGAVGTLGFSCGTTSITIKCDASNCEGCCGANGQCYPYAQQNATICGAQGGACGTCNQGDACTSGVCGNGTCGSRAGEPCCATGTGCLSGLYCVSGTCGTTPPAGGGGGSVPVGTACLNDSACSGGTCKQVGFTGGYCTKTCQVNGDCPSGAFCGLDPSDSSGLSRMCLKGCTTAGAGCDTRTEYACDKRGSFDGTPVCIPKCASGATCSPATKCNLSVGMCCGAVGFACCEGNTCDAGNSCVSGYCEAAAGSGKATGEACTEGAQCVGKICMLPQPNCQTTTCWPGGYCSESCTAAGQCRTGSGCGFFNDGSGGQIGRCLDKCTAPTAANGQGQSDCRTDYVCDRGWTREADNPYICLYKCVAANDCGGASCVNGYCCGLKSYACCNGKGGTCSTGTCNADGYCQ